MTERPSLMEHFGEVPDPRTGPAKALGLTLFNPGKSAKNACLERFNKTYRVKQVPKLCS